MSMTTATRPGLAPPADPVPESLASYAELMATRAPAHRLPCATLAVEFPVPLDNQWQAPQPTRTADLPDPRSWAGQIGQAIIEVLAGRRGLPQLVRWLTPEVYAEVAELSVAAAHRRRSQGEPTHPPARVRRVVVCEPADGVAEASLVIYDGPRVRAVALRLVGLDGRWRVEALHLG